MWIMLLATLAVDTTVHSMITVAPRETLSVTVTGSGAPVVLIPGLFGSAYGFRHLVGPLAEDGYQAITIEPLGVGTSARPKDADYSLTRQATRIAAALDSLQVTEALVMAHSVNAAIAYRLAITRPDLVAGIVAVEGGVAESATTDGFKRAMKFAWLLKLVGGADMVRAKCIRTYERPPSTPPGSPRTPLPRTPLVQPRTLARRLTHSRPCRKQKNHGR